MELRKFLKLYNFKWYNENQKENTEVVRIYVEYPNDWFEFGIYDWNYDNTVRDKLVDKVLNPAILDKEVVSLNYDINNNVFCIHLEENE